MSPHMHPHRWAPSMWCLTDTQDFLWIWYSQLLVAMERLQAVKTPGWLCINSDCRRHTRRFLGGWDRLLTNARRSATGRPAIHHWKWALGCTYRTIQLEETRYRMHPKKRYTASSSAMGTKMYIPSNLLMALVSLRPSKGRAEDMWAPTTCSSNHPNLHDEPHSCVRREDAFCSLCRVGFEESVFW